MKRLGVIAGMGPLAGSHFIQTLLKTINSNSERDYPRIIADFDTSIPSRTRALLYGEESPSLSVINTINRLERYGVDCIAVPCNSMHYWYKEVCKEVRIPWINMVDAVSKEIKRRGLKRVLVLGGYATIEGKLYDKRFETAYPSEKEQQKIFKVIAEVKLGREPSLSLDLSSHGVDAILLACTELSLISGTSQKLIDSLSVYARECIRILKQT